MAAKKPRAFVIGDQDGGLIIVITDPVMVVHYDADDWQSKGDGKDPDALRAAIVEDLVTALRGVDLRKLEEAEREVQNGSPKLTPEEAAKILNEVDHARTIARLVGAGSAVTDVDFCLAFDAEPLITMSRPRMRPRVMPPRPLHDIEDYLFAHYGSQSPGDTASTTPLAPDFDEPRIVDTEPLPPWKEPSSNDPTKT